MGRLFYVDEVQMDSLQRRKVTTITTEYQPCYLHELAKVDDRVYDLNGRRDEWEITYKTQVIKVYAILCCADGKRVSKEVSVQAIGRKKLHEHEVLYINLI